MSDFPPSNPQPSAIARLFDEIEQWPTYGLDAIIPKWQDRLDGLLLAKGIDWKPLLPRLVSILLARPGYNAHQTFSLIKVWLENESVSRSFIEKNSSYEGNQHQDERAALLDAWAYFLVPADAFQFSWCVLTHSNHTGSRSHSEHSLNHRLDTLRMLLLEKPLDATLILLDEHEQKESHKWRQWFLDFFRIIASLTLRENYRFDPSENWVRQSEAAKLLAGEAQRVPAAISLFLTEGEEYWSVLDPIVLDLPPELAVKTLQNFADNNKDSTDQYFHAKSLINHISGELPHTSFEVQQSGILSAVETLIKLSRTKVADQRVRTWIGDAGVESLWHGAIQKAASDFSAYLQSQYGQDEHEHAAVFADSLARNLNATNAVVAEWLRNRQATPLFIKASVRRFPKTSRHGLPQEGGQGGTQADIGFLVDCDFPGQMKAKRITLIQAKKLKQTESGAWASGFAIRGNERDQLVRLLEMSKHAHYLFFLHPDIGNPTLFLPAKMTKDSVRSSPLSTIPLSVVRNGSKDAAEFLLHDILGLWTGDDDERLLQMGNVGSPVFQAPRVMFDVKVVRDEKRLA